ncbi:MAG: tRNA (cytidine(34)-2'-O)-methyltransferase [bacterium]
MINIVLFEPEIPQNTGNIMRTCVATNSRLHLIKPLGFNLDEKNLRRSGVDYIDKIDLSIYENIDEFFSKNEGDYYFLTRYGHTPPSSFDFSNDKTNLYFFFGKESTGIPKEILKPYIDHCMRYPMSDNVRSLNLSNTVAITIYEALRQQDYSNLLFDEPHKSKFEIENS